jgi:hypothetical protein
MLKLYSVLPSFCLSLPLLLVFNAQEHMFNTHSNYHLPSTCPSQCHPHRCFSVVLVPVLSLSIDFSLACMFIKTYLLLFFSILISITAIIHYHSYCLKTTCVYYRESLSSGIQNRLHRCKIKVSVGFLMDLRKNLCSSLS